MTPLVGTDPDALVSELVGADAHVHLAGTPSRSNVLCNALARVHAGRRSLTVSTTAVHSSLHGLTMSGAVKRMITGFLGDTFPSPRPNRLYKRAAEGEPFEVELWSLLTYNQRIMAAALGQPWAVSGTALADTDLPDRLGSHIRRTTGPDGAELTLMTPMAPDIAFYHGVCADTKGNIVMAAPYGEDAWAAFAAKQGVIASVERIVDDETMAALSDRVKIPASRVRAVCEAPLGAHPQSLRTNGIAGVEGYVDDFDHLRSIVAACRDEDTALAWYREWVADTDHKSYVDKVMAGSWQSIRTGADHRYPPAPKPSAIVLDQPATESERLLILGARTIARTVVSGGYDTLLAGIGSSHIAAWLARDLLAEQGHTVTVVAELGMVDMQPVPGDVFLFSLRHSANSAMLSAVPECLGGMVAANANCLGVLSTGEIDMAGNLNSTLLPGGRWVTGAGGAPDIASTTDCVVVTAASPRRYVPKVNWITSPGHRVKAAVTQFGCFERADSGHPFELTTWLPTSELSDPATAVAQQTGWDCAPPHPTVEEPLRRAELRLLRRIDPQGEYR